MPKLGSLHSDQNRLRFLKGIYTPGNTEVADRILAMGEDSSVVEKEIAHAKKAGDIDRFRSMARRYIDYLATSGYESLLGGTIIQWQDPELTEYAIAQMTSKSGNHGLECVARIAQAFGRENVARASLERLLAVQERDNRYKFSAAETLTKLGRFDEAIDRYLEEGLPWFGSAMDLARKHSPNRVCAVAQRGFDSFDVEKDKIWAEFYVECAEVLGKTNEAERVLIKYVKKMNVDSSPRFYHGVVKVLLSFGQEKIARELVERVAKQGDRSEEMAQLYHTIGERNPVRTLYTEMIERAIREGHHPSNTLGLINRAIELTGDRATFMEQRILLHETQEEYEQASQLATELGKPELARNYGVMHQMVQSV